MTLPQQQEWQVTLRDWIASKTLQDFDCGLPGLSFDESYFQSDDDIYRAWITFENRGRDITKIHGVRIDSCCFLLENIESPEGIMMRLDERVEPACLAWLYSWEYAGNPYHQNAAVANRALVGCMVDMIMAYSVHVEDAAKKPYISQDLGSAFATWAYVLDTCKAVLSIPEVARYTETLEVFFKAIEAQGPTGIQADMDLPVLIGLYYTGLFSQGYEEPAETYARKFILDGGEWNGQQKGPYFNEAGYFDHGGGFDPSYNGISLKYLIWLAHATDWDFVKDALDKCYRLKAHLTFPEPGGQVYGPSSFATYNAHGSPNDQHWSFGKSVAASYLTDEAAYLRYGNRNVEVWRKPFGLVTTEQMLADLVQWTNRANNQEEDPNYGRWTRSSDDKPLVWERSKHLGIPSVEWDYYPGSNFYDDEVDAMIAHEDSLPPFNRSKDFINQFGEDFVIWKLGGMAGAIHTGGLSWWNKDNQDGPQLAGLSGGSLCAFWTQEGGIGILGRNRGYPQKENGDTWDNIAEWAVNHVWGTRDGTNYSTARNGDIEVKTIIDGSDNALVSVRNYLVTSVHFGTERILDINKDRLEIYVNTFMTEGYDSLYETLPLWLGDGYPQMPITTMFDEYPALRYRSDGQWLKLWGDEPVEAEAVKLERNGYLMLIEFEEPQRVHLGPVWSTTYQAKHERIVPLHIDILETGSVRYTISGPYKHQLVKA